MLVYLLFSGRTDGSDYLLLSLYTAFIHALLSIFLQLSFQQGLALRQGIYSWYSICCLLLILFDLAWYFGIRVYQKDPIASFPLRSSSAPPPWIPYCKFSVLNLMTCTGVLSLLPHKNMTATEYLSCRYCRRRTTLRQKHATDVNQHCRDRGQLAAIQAQIINFRRCDPRSTWKSRSCPGSAL